MTGRTDFNVRDPVLDNNINLEEELHNSITESINSIAKTAIFAVGAIFLTAKTVSSIPFIIISLPFAYILENIGVLEKGAAFDLCKAWGKNALMANFLFDSIFADTSLDSVGETFKDVCQIVSGTHACYT